MTDTKPFNMFIQAALVVALAAAPMGCIVNRGADYIDKRLELQRSEIQNCIYSSLADLKTDTEWQFILKTLINSKKLNSEQCFKLASIIQNGCKRVRLSVETFLALMMVESEMDSKCLFKGAKGICQVMNVTQLESIGATSDYRWDDPVKNTLACLLYFEYIRSLPQYANETDELVLAASYNRGPFWKDLDDSLAKRYKRKVTYYKEQIRSN